MVSSVKILHTALITNVCLFVSGLTVCLIDLDQYSWGLYMVLVAIVGLIICIAFCLLGPEDQPEPLAKKMWSRMTVKSSVHKPSPKRKSDIENVMVLHKKDLNEVDHQQEELLNRSIEEECCISPISVEPVDCHKVITFTKQLSTSI